MLIRKRGDWVSATVGDRLVMMSVENGSYVGMTRVGARIWALIDKTPQFDAICAQLVAEFRVSEAQCREEARAFLEDLEKQGVVEFDQAAG